MSLLLDALKRAEQEKQAKQGGRPDDDRERPPPPPAPVAIPAAAAKPATSLELQPVVAPAASAPPPRADAQAAQNVFQAKEAAAANAPARKGVMLWVGLAVVVLLVLGAGVYVWYSVQAFTPRFVAGARPKPLPITPAGAGADSPQPARIDVFVPTQQPSTAIQPASPASPAPSAPAEAPKERPAPAPAAARVRETVAQLLKENSSESSPPTLKLSPSRDSLRIAPDVARGYRELVAGDITAAARSYRSALDADPTNLDALLGLATIEARAGNRMLAASHYRRALDVDPRNATALAGLAAVAEFSRPEGIESQLRADIAASPSSAPLHFTLGNLFALQSRWGEAQVEYFEAYRLEPESADFAYNLAVSLDHMRQPKLAAEYYSRALDGARNQATQFDPQVAARRLAQLKG